MPKESGVREGFSPSLYLLNVLIASTESSVQTGEWTNHSLCQTCTKARRKINVCVAENGQVVMLSVCNSQESKARNVIVAPLLGQSTSNLQQKIIHSVRRAKIAIKLDDAVSGQCLENLNAVQVNVSSDHPKMTQALAKVSTRKGRGKTVSKKPSEQGEAGAFSPNYPSGLSKALEQDEALAYRGLIYLALVQNGKVCAINDIRGPLLGLKNWAKNKKLPASKVIKGAHKLRERGILEPANPEDLRPKCFLLHHVQLPGNGQDADSEQAITDVQPKASPVVPTPSNGDNALLSVLAGENKSEDAFGQLVGQAFGQLQGIGNVLALANRLKEAGFEFSDNQDGTQTISLTVKK